jgi:hypothetical protein
MICRLEKGGKGSSELASREGVSARGVGQVC